VTDPQIVSWLLTDTTPVDAPPLTLHVPSSVAPRKSLSTPLLGGDPLGRDRNQHRPNTRFVESTQRLHELLGAVLKSDSCELARRDREDELPSMHQTQQRPNLVGRHTGQGRGESRHRREV
jgi:hypothetical protein